MLLAGVYFAQAMYGLPDQALAIAFKDRQFTADQVALFFLASVHLYLMLTPPHLIGPF